MQLTVRPPVFKLPSYSLTADLLGFLRCGLQYRYTRLGRIPSARPVQLWFGQFIHGVLEEVYRRFDRARRQGNDDLPPWPDERIDEILELLKRRLAARGLVAGEAAVEELGDTRARAAINELGPDLFPIIHKAEIRLTGSREIRVDLIPEEYQGLRQSERYEVLGVVDVVTHVQLSDPTLQNNRLIQGILRELPGGPPSEFEIIIDYKGMRRPPFQPTGDVNYWDTYGWQVQTYGHLRERQEDSWPVAAGVLLYLNELHPIGDDIEDLLQESVSAATDVPVIPGSEVAQILDGWRPRQDVPQLPIEFRLARALRVTPISDRSILESLDRFDETVAKIETCRAREARQGRIITSWDKNPSDTQTCRVCDFKSYCPAYTTENSPGLPGSAA